MERQSRTQIRLGIASELIVCADLVHKGWVVYRAIVGDAPFDLVALTPDGELLRIEVKSNSSRPSDLTRFDLLAVVTAEDVVYLRPDELQEEAR